MRSGYLLAQGEPQDLLRTHNLDSLEDVFLKLCVKTGGNQRDSVAMPLMITANGDVQQSRAAYRTSKNGSFTFNPQSPRRTWAILHKNILQTYRNIGYLYSSNCLKKDI